MKLPEQIQFQGSAESKGFRPVEQASPTQAIEREANRHLENQQQNLALIHRNLTAVEQSKVANFNSGMKNLAAFSQTIATKLEEDEKRRNEEEMQAGLAQAYEEGVPVGQQLEYEQGKVALKAADDQVAGTALYFTKSGAPPEVVDKIKGMSGWRQYGYAMGKARQAGEVYPLWLQERLKTDTTTKIEMPDGTVVTPAEAAGNPLYQAAVTAHLRQEFFQTHGLVGMNPALLNEHTFPGMRKIEGSLLSKARMDYNIGQSEIQLQEYNDQLADGALGTADWFTRVAATLDSEGNARGFSGAWKAFEQLSDEAADAGMPLDLAALGSQIDPETGKTFKERFKRKWVLLEEKQRKHLRGNWDEYQQDQDTEYQQAEEAAINEIGSATEGWTNAEIEAVQKGLVQKYGKRSSKLDELRNYTVDAEQKQQIEAQLKYKAEHGMLTPDDLVGLPLEVQQKYAQFANETTAKELKPHLDSIEETIKGAVKWSPDKALDGMAAIAIGELQTMFRQKFASYLQSGLPASEASLRAAAETRQYFQDSQDPTKFPNSKFFVGGDGNGLKDGKPLLPGQFFPNLLPKALKEGVKPRFERFNTLLKQAQAEGDATKVFDTPGAVLNRQEIQAIGDGKSGNIQVPQMVQYLSNKLNISPWEIINRQRKAAGFKELDKTPSIEAADKLTPRALRLINQFPSPNRSSRAWATTGTFNEAIVPMGLGKEITKAAAANNIDPAWVAAVIDWENRGNWSNKTSPSGAKGIAQFMPDTAREFGVNVNDPVSSVQGAAKYLKYLLDYFKGDMKLATLAYNGGMGNIRRYGGAIPGSKENQEYWPGVQRSMAKYSGGATLSSTLRPRFIQGASGYQGTNDVVPTGHRDQGGRPISFSPKGSQAWRQMIAAGMPFNPAEVASTHRTEQDFIRIRNQGANPAANSRHNHGEAIDAHGATGAWIRKHGAKYGWYANDYEGSHGGHYEFRG